MKKNGFTLIELLAVLAILAIIALIVTPIILNVIDSTKKESFKSSAYGMLNAAKLLQAEKVITSGGSDIVFTYVDSVESSNPNGYSLAYSGLKPTKGFIKIKADGKIAVKITNGNYCATKSENEDEFSVVSGDCGTLQANIDINDTSVTIGLGDTYDLKTGVTAVDALGNAIAASSISYSSSPAFDNNAFGTYTITYSVNDDINDITIQKTRTVTVMNEEYIFNYTGATQTFTVPVSGTYRIELWGESGKGFNFNNNQQSYASYVKGEITLTKDQQFCMLINFGGGVSNGGNGYSGGGATDFRYDCTDVNSFASLKSRIMVAAGGGSAGYNSYASYQGGIGGNAGGLSGYDGLAPNYNSGSLTAYTGKAGTQTAGGAYGTYNSAAIYGTVGTFGYGGAGGTNGWAGGGGGYYGGGAGGYYHQSAMYGGGGGGAGGGSSFISGHNGCNSISESSIVSNIVHTGQANHYSGFVFTNTVMIDGSGYSWTTTKGSQIQMPKSDGTSYALGVGHLGNGVVRITYID